MTLSTLVLLIAALGLSGMAMGRTRALRLVAGDIRQLHSLPSFHGRFTALLAAVPALLIVVVWLLAEPVLIENRVAAQVDPADISEGRALDLAMADVRRIAAGLGRIEGQGADIAKLAADPAALKDALNDAGVILESVPGPSLVTAAQSMKDLRASSRLGLAVTALALAGAGLVFGLSRINADFRARNLTERFTMVILIGCALIAVLTTFGIFGSLVVEAAHFFRLYPARDFFLSTEWTPRFGGGSALGLWPLVWGTLYVSLIALIVAVPVGLMSAIYLSEYASPRLRAWVKPAIEILAGIPTIVYGLFALITVGPLLRDWFAQPMGLGDSSSSVMTAGIVMGIMVIPFVSSLSDDIINAVPQSLRDGSLAIGATPSETVRQVVLPAALPGIVGAILLAASRAIGETMIVVMGAGAAAKLSLNPFEAMTTVTVKIVSQLTGDTEFASPETLVAFALGLTLFIFTLGLNVIALVIVRKYREQYE